MLRRAAVAAILAVASAGCGPRESAEPGAPGGDHPVGVATVQVNEYIQAEVWYPAAAGSEGSETYDVKTFTPYIVQTMLTGDAPSTYTYAATRDAQPANGMFPVVLFSHGFGGFRTQSTFLTAHLAAKGMIVISPDHPSRDLAAALTGASFETEDPQVHLLESLDFLVNDADRFAPHVDASRVAALGHSAGGGTILAASLDERIDGYVSMASGLLGAGSDGESLPNKPSFFISGSVDGVVPPERTLDAFAAAASPSLYWNIEGVGHNGFDDLCTFGNGLGIIGVAMASGLERLLEMQPQMRALGEDGCVAPARPVGETFPAIRDAVAEWLDSLFAGAPAPPALPTSVSVDVKSK
jgi:fermentation-respiration switch protein FrsA (DUF1100 family)